MHDPFHGRDVQISDKLTDRLRGKYASGPHLPNGNPEFGWRQFQAPPVQHEAADRIEALEACLRKIIGEAMHERSADEARLFLGGIAGLAERVLRGGPVED